MKSWLLSWFRSSDSKDDEASSNGTSAPPPTVPPTTYTPTHFMDPTGRSDIEKSRELLIQIRETIKEGLQQMAEFEDNKLANYERDSQRAKTRPSIPQDQTPMQKWAKLKKQASERKKHPKMHTVTAMGVAFGQDAAPKINNNMRFDPARHLWFSLNAADEIHDLDHVGWNPSEMKVAPESWKGKRREYDKLDELSESCKQCEKKHKLLGAWLQKETNADYRSFLDEARKLAIKKLAFDASQASRIMISTGSEGRPTTPAKRVEAKKSTANQPASELDFGSDDETPGFGDNDDGDDWDRDFVVTDSELQLSKDLRESQLTQATNLASAENSQSDIEMWPDNDDEDNYDDLQGNLDISVLNKKFASPIPIPSSAIRTPMSPVLEKQDDSNVESLSSDSEEENGNHTNMIQSDDWDF